MVGKSSADQDMSITLRRQLKSKTHPCVCSGLPAEEGLAFLRRGHPVPPLDPDCCSLCRVPFQVTFFFFGRISFVRILSSDWEFERSFPCRDLLADVRVVVGEFDQRAEDEEEQVLPVKTISVHEKYHHAWPMTYDLALVEVDQHIQFGRFLLATLVFQAALVLLCYWFVPPPPSRNPSKTDMSSFAG